MARSREALRLSQEDLGRIAGMTRQAVYQIETAKNKNLYVDTLLGLAKALEMHPIKLISAYKGENFDSAEDQQQVEVAVVEFMAHCPERLLLEALASRPDDTFRKLLEVRGIENLRALMLAFEKKKANP